MLEDVSDNSRTFVWGPLSEVYGRTQPLFIGFTTFIIF
jgi:hypothetical protein